MEPAVQQGDRLISDMRSVSGASLKRGEIIIFHSPMDPNLILIKRLIAMGGDTIRSADGQIFLNDKPLSEPYVQHSGNAPDELLNFGPTSVPPHKLFVMGDNRDLSLDSRSAEFGLVNESAVMGKPLYIFTAENDRTGKSFR